MIAAVTATGELDALPIGIEMELAPGWKTYWRSPGDAGYPPEIDPKGSANVAAAGLLFPPPHRFSLFGLETFGYGDHVVFPLAMRPEKKAAPLSLRLHVRYLICADICIPEEANLALDLPAGPALPSAEAPIFNRFRSLIPDDGRKIGWSLKAARIEEDRILLDIASLGDPFLSPDLAIEGPPGLLFGKPTLERLADGREVRLIAAIKRETGAPDPRMIPLRVTIFDGDLAMERDLPAGGFPAGGAADGALPSGSGLFAWLVILGLAFLGGLILNVMPCVLPVLALKLSALLGRTQASRRQLRLGFLASAAGIFAFFLILAAILAGLKKAGMAIGWGLQFQQPWFLAALGLVSLAFAANIWGWFQIPMPAFLGRLSLANGRLMARMPHLGAFGEGLLAALLATPCSAPFLGTALGFALARGPGEIAIVFSVMALGFAAPYLAIAALPGAIRFLPRPGPWLLWLKRALGLSMLGTALWLFAILAGWSFRFGEDRIAWRDFAPAQIPALIAENRIVFVDVTADWCLTCRANEALVLDRDPVRERLGASDIVAMRADWTKPDSAIADYLASFGRYGIPFNVVYGPKAPQGLVLPELLEDEAVLAAIRAAGG